MIRTGWLLQEDGLLKMAVTVFAASMLLIVHVAAVVPPPLVELQLPVQATVDPSNGVAVNVTQVP